MLRDCLWASLIFGYSATVLADEEVVREISEFYAHQERFAGNRVPAKLNFVVNYYDHDWGILFAQSGNHCFFVRPGKAPLQMACGDRVELGGYLSKEGGLEAAENGIHVLDTHAYAAPVEATSRLHEWASLTNRIVAVEGYVDEQTATDPAHTRIDLVVKGRKLTVRVLNRGTTLQSFKGYFVKVTGVYTFNSAVGDTTPVIEIWVPEAGKIQAVQSLADDIRFNIPAVSIENAGTVPSTTMVRVIGTVHSQNRGHSLTLRDATGQIDILTGQSDLVPAGSIVEAIGYPNLQGAYFSLAEAHYRKAPSDGLPFLPEQASGSVITLADAILSLPPEELSKRPPVSLTGVVTWFNADSPFFYIQDATAGIMVHRPQGAHDMLNFGAVVKIQGTAVKGLVAPEVQATRLRRGADSIPSSARQMTFDQAFSGVAQNQWIELSGFAHDIVGSGAWSRLECTTSSGEFSAQVPSSPTLKRFKNALLRLRGICTTAVDERGEITGIRLLVQSESDVQVEAALPNDLASLKFNSIAQIRNLGSRVELNHWVRTNGTVTLSVPGNYFYLQDGSDSLRVLCRTRAALKVGSQIEVLGLVGRDAGKRVLREAQVLNTLPAAASSVASITMGENVTYQSDGKMATVTGTMVNLVDRPTQRRLMIQVGQKLIECLFPDPGYNSLPSDISPGATVTCIGVCHVEQDDYLKPRSYSLLLRTPDDVTVIKTAPWFTLERGLYLSGALGSVAILGIVWGTLLRRRVHRQTREIIARKSKEAHLEAELERTSRLESLGILAGGIAHDFNNMLTVTVGNISLAMMETPSDSKVAALLTEAEDGAMKARELTQQLLTFSRGGDPVRTPVNLAALIKEAAEFATHGSSIVLDFDFDADLHPALADKNQISQVVQNIVIRALDSMVSGGKIRFSLRETHVFQGDFAALKPGRYLKLTVTDEGAGIPADQIGRIFDPYFSIKSGSSALGLATAHSIVRRHEGHIEVVSRVEEGTTFTVFLPAAEALPPPPPPSPELPAVPQGLKVLFMDDDDSIRRFAISLFERLGHTATVVSNGTEAVHAYAAAWEVDMPFDVVILDLTVPGGMGGSEALEHLQNINPKVKAIVSSGYSSDPIMSDYKKHGFSAIVSKPYKISELSKALQEIVADKN